MTIIFDRFMFVSKFVLFIMDQAPNGAFFLLTIESSQTALGLVHFIKRLLHFIIYYVFIIFINSILPLLPK